MRWEKKKEKANILILLLMPEYSSPFFPLYEGKGWCPVYISLQHTSSVYVQCSCTVHTYIYAEPLVLLGLWWFWPGGGGWGGGRRGGGDVRPRSPRSKQRLLHREGHALHTFKSGQQQWSGNAYFFLLNFSIVRLRLKIWRRKNCLRYYY